MTKLVTIGTLLLAGIAFVGCSVEGQLKDMRAAEPTAVVNYRADTAELANCIARKWVDQYGIAPTVTVFGGVATLTRIQKTVVYWDLELSNGRAKVRDRPSLRDFTDEVAGLVTQCDDLLIEG